MEPRGGRTAAPGVCLRHRHPGHGRGARQEAGRHSVEAEKDRLGLTDGECAVFKTEEGAASMLIACGVQMRNCANHDMVKIETPIHLGTL
ncbi:hypothetical protein TRIP_B330516 [uncultured Desulfatiglans sp.]|uniref:Uncharacterized protein n=1 Tax=Uncultured Desulfatiglans sp. TaxID=1748965 RepID=A0A653A8R8_UNCDX|nr:hypothetical protein TRIP_B330516 [uncultured Desulfatiglans sp.]